MPRVRILCNCPVDHLPEVKRALESIGEVRYAQHTYQELLEAIGAYDALVPSLDIALDEKLLGRARRLRLIATPSTGTDHIDLKCTTKLGITVLSLKDDYEFLKGVAATAEHAFGLMLAIVRRTPFAFASVRGGGWHSQDFRGRELLDKTLGIIGYGRLGEMMARYGHAFGMRILACDPYKTAGEPFVKQVDFGTLLRCSDIITIHVHLNDETRNMMSDFAFSQVKPGSYLVNTSRGAVVDERALLDALESGKVAGAALDVICGELDGNLEQHPLIRYAQTHDNLIITPHLGGVTYESQAKAYAHTARKIEQFFQAKPGSASRAAVQEPEKGE